MRVFRTGSGPKLSQFAVATITTEDFYGCPPCRGLDEWEGSFRHLVQNALGQGYAGLRVVSDGTAVIASTNEASVVAWELRLGRLVTEYPLQVVCGFSANEVDKGQACDLVSVHTSSRGPIPVPQATFHVGSNTLTLRGELDTATIHLLDIALSETTGDVTVDMGEVEFIDLQSIQRLGRFVNQAGFDGRTVRFGNVPAIFSKVWDLLQGQWRPNG